MRTIEERLSFLERFLKPTITPAADPRVVALEHVPGCAPVRHYVTRSNAMARGWEIEVRK